MIRTIGIDPGTQCGYAWTDDNFVRSPQSGVWNLKPNRHEGGGMRFLRLDNYLADMIKTGEEGGTRIYYEEVRGHRGTDAAQIYGGIIATITSLCEDLGFPYAGVPVGTIKKHATGKGNANKAAMLAEARNRFGPAVVDDNQADALWILDYARVNLV